MNLVKILSISFDKRRRSCHGENVATLRDFLSKIVVDKRDLKNPSLQGYLDVLENSTKGVKEGLPKVYNLNKLYPAHKVIS